jgi:peptide chain release factor
MTSNQNITQAASQTTTRNSMGGREEITAPYRGTPDRCILLVSSGNGPGECQQAVAHVLEAISKDAETRGKGVKPIDVDISERKGAAGPSSAIVILKGKGARTLGAAWTGVMQWKCQSQLRPRHRRKNWFVQVFELAPAAERVEVDPAEVDMQAIRAGGPGGQHVNKTSSAIRARWVSPEGSVYSVVVRDQRSQHQNRKIAVERIVALAAADVSQGVAERKSGSRHLHHQLERGNPSRTFEGASFMEV